MIVKLIDRMKVADGKKVVLCPKPSKVKVPRFSFINRYRTQK